ncbi:MAG: glyoxalase [Chloroflexi bacterium]|jgi:catechol 2,3-dioxygenase|nr:glyoxalase [Chloroflexota bacterium]MCH2537189.1 VOC family protein [Dehalococcoidia bacterium]MEE2926931.1 VOC family protein [Chloroflexota bacterium]HIM49770.1 glyoxalase [Dehalococcoidia bacterium]|tara:strand:- start:52 stop:504 length:453 start_codon:yes stop_codon:yes gene_type:complete
MGRISGLSHVGVFVKDLDTMTQFYCDTLGLTESHRNGDRMVFLSADVQKEDHEVVLVRGRDGDAKIIQQLSFRVGTIDDVRAFYQTFQQMGVEIQQTVSHGAGASCYFYDPEGNRLEVFADIEVEGGRGYSGPIDLEKSAEELVAQINAG